MNNAFELKHVRKSYAEFCLDDITLALPEGCVLGLAGENGAGKTTLIKILLNMVQKYEGEVQILGENGHDASRIMDDIGIVFDVPGLPAALNAVQTGKVMKRAFGRWDEAAYANYLDQFDIPRNTTFDKMSRGTKMKLSIAIALAHRPRLLILDEPTGGLDPVARDEFIDILSDFMREDGHSILISSHITSDLEKLSDYVAFLHKGRLIAFDEKDALVESHCVAHLTNDQFRSLPANAVIGSRATHYGVDAVIKREAATHDFNISPVSLEELFIAVAKEGK